MVELVMRQHGKEVYVVSGKPQDNGLQRVKAGVEELVNSRTAVEEQRIRYGNLRYECSDWNGEDEAITNIAVIYETPGGSTCQINVEYNHQSAEFTFLGDTLEETIVTNEPQQVLEVVDKHVRAIPRKRLQQLYKQIDSWVAEGKTRKQLFSEFNKLLQTEFLGGRISTSELKEGIQYTLTHFSSPD